MLHPAPETLSREARNEAFRRDLAKVIELRRLDVQPLVSSRQVARQGLFVSALVLVAVLLVMSAVL